MTILLCFKMFNWIRLETSLH